MTDPFNSPASGGNFSNKDHLGKLLVVTPTEYVKQMQTSSGVSDAIRCNIAVIDETSPAESLEYDDALIFGKVLNGQIRPFVNKGLVLGRLTQGVAKPGKNAPWVLSDPTDDEKVAARAYLATKAPQL